MIDNNTDANEEQNMKTRTFDTSGYDVEGDSLIDGYAVAIRAVSEDQTYGGGFYGYEKLGLPMAALACGTVDIPEPGMQPGLAAKIDISGRWEWNADDPERTVEWIGPDELDHGSTRAVRHGYKDDYEGLLTRAFVHMKSIESDQLILSLPTPSFEGRRRVQDYVDKRFGEVTHIVCEPIVSGGPVLHSIDFADDEPTSDNPWEEYR